MSIQDVGFRRKVLWGCLWVGVLTGIVGGVGIAYGRGKEVAKPPVFVLQGSVQTAPAGTDAGQMTQGSSGQKAIATGKFVASRNGKRYYPAGCSAAGRISSANLIAFQSEEEAQARGLTRAATCKF